MDSLRKVLVYPFTKPVVVATYVWKLLSPIIPAKLYILVLYRLRFGYWMDLKNPKSFNEKLQWLKLYDHRPEYIKLVDKYEVKKIVEEQIGEDHIVPTIGVWDKVKDVDISKLPNQFVLKCTHDSGGLVICKDKNSLDWHEAKKKLNKCLRASYYNEGKEWPYKHVPHRIIAEQYIAPTPGMEDLPDYKFFCFNGVVKMFKVDYDRFIGHHANYYDRNCNLLLFGEVTCPPDFNRSIYIPSNVEQMILFAEKLSKKYPFVRVDFYNTNGNIFFGELTFYPASGMGLFEPQDWDNVLGSWLKLN